MRCLSFLVAALLAGLASAAAAQPAACPPPPPGPQVLDGAADGRDRGFLWRLDKDGRSSWLYGTVHANRADWARPGPRVLAAAAASDVLALELDPFDPELPRVMAEAADPARARRVAGALQPRIDRLAAAACVDAGRLRTLPPLFQLMVLGLQEARRDGFHPELGVDAALHAVARGRRQEVLALETPAAQREALMGATEEDERVLLEQGVAELEQGGSRQALRRLFTAWAEADLATLESYPQWCACLDTLAERRYLRRLNDGRNGPMAERLARLHASGRSFFAAVGALHMSGPRPLPLLLRAQGFAVQPISFSPGTTP